MKKFLVLLGILSIAFTAIPLPVSAAGVSPYTEALLQRADEGLSYATNGDFVMQFFENQKFDWSREVLSAVLQSVDTNLRVVQQTKSLQTDSSCLRADLFLVEQKLEEARTKLKEAFEQRNIVSIFRLTDLIVFLNERYQYMIRGARDPKFEDASWYQKRMFDPPNDQGWCCTPNNGAMCQQQTLQSCTAGGNSWFFGTLNECSAFGCQAPQENTNELRMCPFTTDYLPPSVEGFGCDTETMSKVLNDLPGGTALQKSTQAELEALTMVQSTIQDYFAESRAFQQVLQQALGGIITGGELPTNPLEDRKHKVVKGCMIDNVCANDLNRSCVSASDCGGEQCIDVTTVGRCSNDASKKCTQDSTCGSKETCDTVSDAILHELRGPFSLEPDHVRLLEAFREVRRSQAEARPSPGFLSVQANPDGLPRLLRDFTEKKLRSFSTDQGEKESRMFATSVDPELRTEEQFFELNSSIATLSRLGSDKNVGLRGFVRNFAFFLRLTCIDRPCNKRLDNILKIVFEDECFPYADGKFLSDTCQNPRWQQCQEKAFGVDLPNPTDCPAPQTPSGGSPNTGEEEVSTAPMQPTAPSGFIGGAGGGIIGGLLGDGGIKLLEPIGGLTEIPAADGLIALFIYFDAVYPWAVGTAAGIAVLWAISGGVMIMMAGGDSGKTKLGKDKLTQASIGLLVILLSGIILNFLNPTFFLL